MPDFHVQKMTTDDIPFSISLTDTLRWDLTDEDFRFMMRLEPDGCFVLQRGKARIGIATTICYGKTGWLGNIIIDEKYRGQGGGSILVRAAIQYLRGKGADTIGLYSYLNRRTFYEKQNLRYESEFEFLKGKGFSANRNEDTKEVAEEDFTRIFELSQNQFGDSRQKLLEPLIIDKDNYSYVLLRDKKIVGFAVAKTFDETAEIGPLVCEPGCVEASLRIIETILNILEDYEVSICVPQKETEIIRMLLDKGFKKEFTVARMLCGPFLMNDYVYAAESLERG